MVFFAKQVLIDTIDSELRFFYNKPTLMGNAEKQLVENMVPFVNQGILRQKIYIIPDEAEY